MYHCRVCFYFIGSQNKLFEIVKNAPALEDFTHEFIGSVQPEQELTEQADVLFACLQDTDAAQTLRMLTAWKKQETELIVLADKGQVASIEAFLPQIKDLWILPLSEAELKFRFCRWQEQNKAEKDHWQTNQFLEAAINSVPNLVWYKDKEGIHEKVNDSFCRTVNKTRQQVEGQRHAYIWDVEKEDPACMESDMEVMSGGKTCVSEEAVQTREGTKLLTTYKSPLYDLDGSVMGTIGVGIDVTLERGYEQELIQKNHALETLFMTMDCGVLCHSVDGTRIISVNQAALKILGYTTKKDLMESGFDMISTSVVEEDKARLREGIKSLKQVGDSVSIDYRVQHTDGEKLHVIGNVKLMEEGGELFYQRFLLDCTEQKQQEERERREKERRQMELIHALSIDYNLACYFDLDTGEGTPLRITGRDKQILQSIFSGSISMDKSMAAYIDNCVYEDDREELHRAVSRDRLKKELYDKKMQYFNYRTTCCGELRHFQMNIVRAGKWDKNRGIVIGFRNMDEETRREMEKKNLLEDALMQANRASKAKSVFLSNMSHDIRTPMNAIIGFTTLAITHIEQKEQVEEYLKKIMSSGNHLLSLINDVLDMSRIESGKMHLEEKPCSLPDILHGLRNMIQADIHAKQIDLYMDAVDVLDEEIYCDRLRLNQVLLNLLSNSIKYTGAGGIVSLKITQRPGAPAGFAHYEFHIKDTGIGMSEEFVSRIFEPFERERNSTISGIQGTGLGMAITKNIVDMMNGSIEVTSKQGVGTESIVSFMFRINTGAREMQTIPELKNCRALVVDDDFNSCDSVSCMLQQFGLRAEWTLSGKEAVLRTRQAVMRGDSFQIYIIDWLLPDMNGIEVARRVRKEMGEEVPIIVLTAYDWSDIEEEAKEAGITAFCSKPLFASELRSCLRSIVTVEEGETAEGTIPSGFRTGHILLVEDNELNQEIASAILKEAGFTLDIAGNGQIAVDMMKASQPGQYQLVLMDVQMPEMNGYEATREIRKLPNQELAKIPIFAMTANAFEEDKQEAIKSGMNGHIAKPINIENLMGTLDRVLCDA